MHALLASNPSNSSIYFALSIGALELGLMISISEEYYGDINVMVMLEWTQKAEKVMYTVNVTPQLPIVLTGNALPSV